MLRFLFATQSAGPKGRQALSLAEMVYGPPGNAAADRRDTHEVDIELDLFLIANNWMTVNATIEQSSSAKTWSASRQCFVDRNCNSTPNAEDRVLRRRHHSTLAC